MQSQLICFVMVIIIVFNEKAFSEEKCAEGEIYKGGCPSACDPTCKYLGESVMCIMWCDPGCHCKNGYARDGNNICIPIEDCPKTYE
uniref:TIL domain-containing protein n=1 Tax=Meloidogyne javanica TaxID=6303 RepID=A0A915LJD0_MELJA